MTDFSGYALWAAACGYLAAFAAGLPALRRDAGDSSRRVLLFAIAILAAAFLLQSAGMAFAGLSEGSCPVGSPSEILHFVAWSVVAMYALSGSAFKTPVPGLFASALAAGLAIAAQFAGRDSIALGASGVAMAHASLSLFAYGAFGFSALCSTMYLIQLRGLRARRWAGVFRLLPSLRELDAAGRRLLHAGFAVFTLALALGGWWMLRAHAPVSGTKLLFATLVWAGYGALELWRPRGVKLAVSSILLFALALFTLYPVQHRIPADRPAARETEALPE